MRWMYLHVHKVRDIFVIASFLQLNAQTLLISIRLGYSFGGFFREAGKGIGKRIKRPINNYNCMVWKGRRHLPGSEVSQHATEQNKEKNTSIFSAFPFWCSTKCCFIGGLLKRPSSYTLLYLPQLVAINLFLKMVSFIFHVLPMEKEFKFLDSLLGMTPFPRAKGQEQLEDHRRQQSFYHALGKSLTHFYTRKKDRWMKYTCKQWLSPELSSSSFALYAGN